MRISPADSNELTVYHNPCTHKNEMNIQKEIPVFHERNSRKINELPELCSAMAVKGGGSLQHLLYLQDVGHHTKLQG
jgi:hypothetical protein